MGVRSVTGQEAQAIASLSTARTPPAGVPNAAPKATARDVRASTEPSKGEARQPVNVPAPAPVPVNERAGTKLRMDSATDRLVAQIVNTEREVIKQIPPDELLKIVANVRRMQGLLFDKEA